MLKALSRKIAKALLLVRIDRYRKALLSGVAAAVEHNVVMRCIHTACIVDVGANKGQFALVARECLPTAIVYSFEPLHKPCTVFRKIFRDDSRVSLFESAVGPTAENALIHVSRRDDSSSLLPITERQESIFPGTGEASTERIRVAPLRDLLASVSLPSNSFLKLDVQGFELQALAGCEELIKKFSWVYAECSFVELYRGQALADEVVDWLAVREFRLAGVYNVSYDAKGLAVQADFLFERKSSSAARIS